MRRATRTIGWLALIALGAAACGSSAPSVGPAATPVTTAAPTTPVTPAPGSACTPAEPAASADWNERTWYEVFVRSFADSDGDGIGDLRGLTAKLDYLNDGDPTTTDDLGVGGLWLMPIAASPSYHGYDVTDYRTINPDYGTREDFDAFLAAAHERGIKVIVDLVLNHTSSEHPWFSRRADAGLRARRLVRVGDLEPGLPRALRRGSRGTSSATAGTTARSRTRCRTSTCATPRSPPSSRMSPGSGSTDMGVDGFRLDAAKHLIEDGKDQVNTPETHDWLAGFKRSVDATKPGSLLVGEVFDPATIAGRYVPESADLTFNFSLATAVRLALQDGRAPPLATGFLDTIADWPPNQSATFLSNHDQDRIMSQLRGDLPSAKLAAFMLLTEPGVPFLYYGEEIGMTGAKPDERIRTPMRWTADGGAGFSKAEPWEALSEDPADVNVASESADPDSLLSTYRDLIEVRGTHEALRTGTTTVVEAGAEPVFAWLRTTPDQALLAVVNVSDQPVDAYGLSLPTGPLCGPVTARILATVGGDAATPISPPVVTAAGGLDAWRPVPALPARSGYLLALEPAP